MKAHRHQPHSAKLGMSHMEVVVVIFVIIAAVTGIFCATIVWKRGDDRSANILNIRNCQMAMRGHQSMFQLLPGDPFVRRNLEEYMKFPTDMPVLEGMIKYQAGDKATPQSADPAVNGDHLWLKMDAPCTQDYVGRYGWDDIAEVSGW